MDFNFLGVGPLELVLIFLLMLTIAGPKRMIKWSYELGRQTAKFRAMFQETMDAFKREIEASDLDVTKDIKDVTALTKKGSTRFDIVKEANKVVKGALESPSSKTASNSAAATTTAVAAVNDAPSADASTNNAATPNEQSRYDSWQPQ